MSDLRDKILAAIRAGSGNGKPIRLRSLTHLSDRGRCRGRHIDGYLQRMRRAGQIRYDSKLGWLAVEEAEP